MKVFKPVFIAVIVVLLAGCTAVVKDTKKQQIIVDKGYQFSQVQVHVSDEVKKMLHKSFSIDKLKKRIEIRLRQDGLWNDKSPNTLDIGLTHMYSRNTALAVILPISGSDKLYADVKVLNKHGKTAEQFMVELHYSLGGTISGWAFVRMAFLYHNCAMTLSNYFTGKSPHD